MYIEQRVTIALVAVFLLVFGISCDMDPTVVSDQEMGGDFHVAPPVYLQGAQPNDNPTQLQRARIVHISDTHRMINKHFIPDGDILVHSGDFSDNGTKQETEIFVEFMGKFTHKHKIVVLGNHELGWDEKNTDEIEELLGPKIIWLHDKGIKLEGIQFYGSSWNNMSKPQAFGLPRPELDEIWKTIPKGVEVLVTHLPPKGILDLAFDNHVQRASCDLCNKLHSKFSHWGSEGLLSRVKELQVPIHLFGHVHDSSGIIVKDGTVFSNAALHSINKNGAKIAYGKAVVIDVYRPKNI